MGKRYVRIAAVLCALGYAAVVGTALYRIVSRSAAIETLAQTEFTTLVDRANAAAALGFLDEPFREAVKNAVERSHTLAAAIVTGPNGPEYAVERGPGYLVPLDGTPRFTERFDVAPQPLVSSLRTETVRNATVSAARLRIQPEELFEILRDALILTAVPIAAAVLLLILGSAEGQRVPVPEGPTEADSPPVGVDSFEEEFEIPEIAEDLVIQEEGPPPLDVVEAGESGLGTTPLRAEVEEPRVPEEEPLEAGASFPEEGPSGLFSSRSNLGWETYLEERLASELRRASSFEQDLVLLFFDLAGPEAAAQYRPMAEEIVSFFSFRDLAFEHGPTGAAVILPNIDLDHGLRMAEEFYAGRAKDFAGDGATLYVGISARAGRLVEAERLVAEASSALERAREDPATRIIAFKPDLERYRSFIAGLR